MVKKLLAVSVLILRFSAPAGAQVIEKVVNYQHGGTPLQGLLAYDDAISANAARASI
jgi:predicted secreted Zn-dependent protease